MLIECIELTMSHVGLGHLTEYGLMLLFGNAHSQGLTLDVENNPDQILDHQGHVLYPAYFLTHLKVPASCPLSSFKLWDRVEVGVEISRFGDTLLESRYLLARDGELPEELETWNPDDLPFMKGNNLMVIDIAEGSAAKKVAVPTSQTISSLPRMRTPPEALLRTKNVRQNGFRPVQDCRLRTRTPILLPILPGRDVAPGRALVFAKFVEMMDTAEFLFLSEGLSPGFPTELLQHLAILERETCYYGNALAGDRLEMHISGDISACDPGYHGEALHLISCALLDLQIEVYQHQTRSLLVLARVKKLLVVPTERAELIGDVKRLLTQI